MNDDSVRERLADLWFAIRSERGTLECYRMIRSNRDVIRALDILEADQ